MKQKNKILQKNNLLIIGMGYVSENPHLASKQQICDYLCGISQQFNVYWICEKIKKEGFSHNVPSSITTIISSNNYNDVDFNGTFCIASPDVVLISFNALMKLPIYVIVRLLLLRTKIVLYVGTDYLYDWKEGPYYNLKTLAKKIKAKLTIPFLSSIICRGAKLTSDYQTKHCPTYKTVPIISEPNKRGTRLINGEYILFIGNLNGAKGYHDLVETFVASGLHSKQTLVCVGPTSNEQSKIENGKIIHVGRVNEVQKIYDYLHYAELLIVPSKRSSGEGVPRVIDEAILAKTPRILSTPLPGIVAEHGKRIDFSQNYKITGDELLKAHQKEPSKYDLSWSDPSLQHTELLLSCLK